MTVPSQIFMSAGDHAVDLAMQREMYWSMISRCKYYVLNQADTPLNHYGEPDDPISSPLYVADQVYANVAALLADTGQADGTRGYATAEVSYYVVADGTWVVDTGGPLYTLFETPEGYPSSIPIHIKLDPETEELDKYGYDRKRDALLYFSVPILEEVGLSPKVGDRVDFDFTHLGISIVEQFELHEVSPVDFQRQTEYSYTVVAAVDRTQKALTTGS